LLAIKTSAGLETRATADLEIGATENRRYKDRSLYARLNRLLKNSVSPESCRRLKPAHIRNKDLIGTTKVVP